MMEDFAKRPEIQDIILGNFIGGVAAELSKRLHIDGAKALELFYGSRTCAKLHNKRTGLYLFSEMYLADEFILELQTGV